MAGKTSQKSVELISSVVGRTARNLMARTEAEFKEEVHKMPEGDTYDEKLACLRRNRQGWSNAGASGEIVSAFMRDGEVKVLIEDDISGHVFEAFLTHCVLKPN